MLEKNKKYTVAWFKLADFITRREKERALGMYRLLMHSFNNKALAYQLEGDIFFAFSDRQSVYSYEKAARLYESHDKLLEAVLLYEQLCNYCEDVPKDSTLNYRDYAQKTFDIYRVLGYEEQFLRACKRLLRLYCQARDWTSLETLLTEYISAKKDIKEKNIRELTELYEPLVEYLLSYKIKDIFLLKKYSKILLDIYLDKEEKKVQSLLAKLKAYNIKLYQEICSYL